MTSVTAPTSTPSKRRRSDLEKASARALVKFSLFDQTLKLPSEVWFITRWKRSHTPCPLGRTCVWHPPTPKRSSVSDRSDEALNHTITALFTQPVISGSVITHRPVTPDPNPVTTDPVTLKSVFLLETQFWSWFYCAINPWQPLRFSMSKVWQEKFNCSRAEEAWTNLAQ